MEMLGKNPEALLKNIIVGRRTPHIYGFFTPLVSGALKVGDTSRPVDARLQEWSNIFGDITKVFSAPAMVDENTYFRDYSVHKYFEKTLEKQRLTPDSPQYRADYYSNEFFSDITPENIQEAVNQITESWKKNTGEYDFYDAATSLPQPHVYERGNEWIPRPNQQKVVDNFMKAISEGRTNLLLYAVMRFGKSFTSMLCAKNMGAKTVLVVSAKADVKTEWKRAVQQPANFDGFIFVDSEMLINDSSVINKIHKNGDVAVVFLTLQDLASKQIKSKHRQVFNTPIDLLVVDETHFGARAAEYGRVLQQAGSRKILQQEIEDQTDPSLLKKEISRFNTRYRLHLSGTPYKILMGSEFGEKDVIGSIQFTEIIEEQKQWDETNLGKKGVNEWENPYYGFPQMIRFAFNPNESSRKLIEDLKKDDTSSDFSVLFAPKSIVFKKNGDHKLFRHEQQILELLQVIDGSKKDHNLFGFLDSPKLQSAKMMRHMVMVLPYCASCDAMEKLLKDNIDMFKNLSEYEIVNISGVEGSKTWQTIDQIKEKIRACESENKKTITLTVNRMLTGSTVPQWDTMILLKDTSSPQEYDQAIFRIQNQHVRDYVNKESGDIIRENLKPQTLLVDFSPNRMFRIQEQTALASTINTKYFGNHNLREKIEKELTISPIIVYNAGKMSEITATSIMEAISGYNSSRSIQDEALDVPPDYNLLSDGQVEKTILKQSRIGERAVLEVEPSEHEKTDLDIQDYNKTNPPTTGAKNDSVVFTELSEAKKMRIIGEKIQAYYQRILFYSMLSSGYKASLHDIIESLVTPENQRIAKNLDLDVEILRKIEKLFDPFRLCQLDYKIQNISQLGEDSKLTPIQRALTSIQKFNRISTSEVRMQLSVCKTMIEKAGDDSLRKTIDSGEKILDISSKTGEFAVSLYEYLTTKLGYKHEQIKDSICSIPSSNIAYEFTYKFYEILGLNTKNILPYSSLSLSNNSDTLNVDMERFADVIGKVETLNNIEEYLQKRGGKI